MHETMPATDVTDAKIQLHRLGGCALLIGVEAYDGLAATQQLLAGRNDVLAYWKLCRRLGYQPANIRVLTSPTLTVDDIVRAEQELGSVLHDTLTNALIRARVESWFTGPAPVVLGDASRDAIVQGVEWLANQLVYPVQRDWRGWQLECELAGLPGLLAYSGHGAHRDGDLVLCPSDVGRGLERAIPFAELRTLVDAGDGRKAQGTPHAADNLTVVLDCCFAGAAAASSALRVPTISPPGRVPTLTAKQEIGNRVFCASGRDEPAYQSVLGGLWHGGFTWAFTRAIEQWQIIPSGPFQKTTVSHVELLFRARMLLEALSFPQHPMLVDSLANLPVFQFDGDASDQSSAEPNTHRLWGQIDPSDGFAHYQILDPDKRVLASIISTAVSDTASGMEAGWEYWKIHGKELKSSNYPTLIVYKVRTGAWSSAEPPPFTKDEMDFSCPVNIPWERKSSTAHCHQQDQHVQAGNASGFGIDVSLTSDNAWEGEMMFFRKDEDELLFKELPPGSTTSFVLGSYTNQYQCSVMSKYLTTIRQRPDR